MKTLTPGHCYELASFESDGRPGQRLQFIEKVPLQNSHVGALQTVNNGTTNEEVLTMLVDRLQYLQTKFPSRENAIVITKLEESLMWLEKRTADRLKRRVEGKALP